MSTYVNLLDKMVEGRTLPEGTDSWAVRSVHPDLRSSRGYRWPFPGQWAEASGPFFRDNKSGCPDAVGDGICAATTWFGMASGGIPAVALLLVAYNSDDVLGTEEYGKLRARRFYVVDLVDGANLVRRHGAEANLRYADLRGANLAGANLTYANLRGADLKGTNLRGADLKGANLTGANLTYADLRGANLKGANLAGANLTGANLTYADLRGADLKGANLAGANLTYADLRGADLRYANLWGAVGVER